MIVCEGLVADSLFCWRAAVHYEAGDLDKSIATAQRAIEEGREIRADFKLIAK